MRGGDIARCLSPETHRGEICSPWLGPLSLIFPAHPQSLLPRDSCPVGRGFQVSLCCL